MPIDFTFTDDGFFVRIMPQTPAAVAVWNESIAPQTDGTGKILAVHLPSMRAQLKAAGYSLRKTAPVRMSDDELLAALNQ